MTNAELWLEYLQLALSWPPVALMITLVVVYTFKSNIAKFIDRSEEVTTPIGAMKGTPQPLPSEERKAPKELPPIKDELPAGISEGEAKEILERLHEERQNARIWHYKYLNNFLVTNTQRMLDGVGEQESGIQESLLKLALHQAGLGADEFLAIMSALATNDLVTTNKGLVEITTKGRDYLAWRGPMPFAPVVVPVPIISEGLLGGAKLGAIGAMLDRSKDDPTIPRSE